MESRQLQVSEKRIRGAFSQVVMGNLLILILLVISLSSFKPIPEYAFMWPTAFGIPKGDRPKSLPYVIPPEYQKMVIDAADETGVPVWMLARLFSYETTGDPLSGRWNPRAVSYTGDPGLAQISKANLELFSHLFNDDQPIDPFDPATAIRIASRYLAANIASAGWRDGVMAYNGGLGHYLRPDKYGDWLPETVLYAKRIGGL